MSLENYLQRMHEVEGWLDRAAATVIGRLALHQTEIRLRGDVLEIGVHHGRLFLLLALCTAACEKAVAVDIFQNQHLNVSRSGGGDLDVLKQNIREFAPHIAIELVTANSMDLDDNFIERHAAMRFISIDGGHTRDITANDLHLSDRLLRPGGIVALDDIYRTDWSGVTAALHRYYSKGGRLVPFALVPNKALFASDATFAEQYKNVLLNRCAGMLSRVRKNRQYQQFFEFDGVLNLVASD